MNVWTPERIAIARQTFEKWHGTPHRDHIAVVGEGIDCAQLVNEILVDTGIVERIDLGRYDTRDGLHGKSHRLAKAIERLLHVDPVSKDSPQFGDIAVYQTGNTSGHCGFIGGNKVWHSLANVGVTHGQYKIWRHSIEFLYRLNAPGFRSTDVTNL